METTAKDIMSTELLSAMEEMSIEEVLKLMVNNHITGVPVVDRGGKMVGILSEYDLITQISKGPKLSSVVLQQKISFSRKVESIDETAPLEHIIQSFIKTKLRRLPVVDSGGKLLGIITRGDIMRVLYYRSTLTES